MSSEDTVLCPDCGWTGQRSDLDDAGADVTCPVCAAAFEYVD